jgi:hypothetical protein
LTKIQLIFEIQFSGFIQTSESDIAVRSEWILKFSKGIESVFQVLVLIY